MRVHKHTICRIVITTGVLATSVMTYHQADLALVLGFNAVINLLWIWEN